MACCARCDNPMTPGVHGEHAPDMHGGRGLCTTCYDAERYTGRHIDYPRRTRSREELMAEWDHLRRSGVTWQHAHERLGMQHASFRRAYERARAAGDRRAIDGEGQRPLVHRRDLLDDDEPVRWSTAPTMQAALDEAFGRSA